MGFGMSHQTAVLSGTTAHFTILGFDTVTPGGLFALGTNSGNFSHNVFAVVPEGSASIGYRVSEAVTLSVGYTFLYWSEVARPGGLIDRRIDRAQVPSSLNFDPTAEPTSPSQQIRSAGFWTQGVSIGVQVRY
jgi:hypothetical protein